ncbi:hypothetical protein PGTUg99_036599 [Puccinia graminis f. sp. tritici]|uniref:DUF6589 domain-containing protein n=1 Tax=Puccinia graminis f. sp. tritici TaxID=56615 RepID=A0A5B0PMH1_PUCGR|nr:hypothetical protein PGTUg99_036599 [Puccinia graminis f. sp. tritici]
MTPKEFIMEFLCSSDSDLASRRRFWATENGWDGTMDLVRVVRSKFRATSEGEKRWQEYIQEEAIEILTRQVPRQGMYPMGTFQSANSVEPEFFSNRSRAERDHILRTEDTPFLYSIIRGMLINGTQVYSTAQPLTGDELDDMESSIPEDEARLLEEDGITYVKNKDRVDFVSQRAHRLAITICSMVSFARNRRHNSLQLQNAVRFLACGVSERMNEYLHYLGLTSSRQTAIAALKTLTGHAEEHLTSVMSLDPKDPNFGPFICLDNLDMEEKVHMSSVGHRSMMFHGTWGYVQLPSRKLLDTLDRSSLNLTAYQRAINQLPSMTLDPELWMPSTEDDAHYKLVWKSQIARVLKEYIAVPSSTHGAIALDPPVLEQISCEKPTIHMFKLMDESDNSAEGIGQVLESIRRQSGVEPEEFFSRLQPMDGDLGTCQNFNSLRDIRYPSDDPQNNLNNTVFQLGCSHTLWNIAQTIFTTHFGNTSNEEDLGAWRTLSALGIPPEKVVQKKHQKRWSRRKIIQP